MYSGKALRVTALPGDLAELTFDRSGESVNKFDTLTLTELKEATQALLTLPNLRGVLVTSAKDVFIVGADIFEFVDMFKESAEGIAAVIAEKGTYFTAFADLPVPSVVAINGFALGAGLEMALAGDYRAMSSAAKIGLPEVTLGIIPGYGGTVRLPRLIPLKQALDWITSGRPQEAHSALQAGAVDTVVEPEALRTAALDLLKTVIGNPTEWQDRRRRRNGPIMGDAAALGAVFAEAKSSVGKTAIHVPALLGAIESIEKVAGKNCETALADEAATMGRMAKTQAADAMVQNFINDQAIKKLGKGYAKLARKLGQGAVLGAGIMGGGIAYTSAVRGTPVIMKDLDQKALDLGIGEARKLLAKQVETRRLKQDKADAVLASIRPQLDFENFTSADVLVEAIVENLGIKKRVFAEVEKLVRPDAILASNTSSLSITDLASVLERPENFVGMHFFNPVPLMPLVEVIKGPKTSDVAAATIAGYALAMGKTPIVVKDCPGFLVNRLLIAYFCGFEKLVADGADFREIDRVMEAFGWPMGPAFLLDVIGIDTGKHVLDIISAGYPERMVRNYRSATDVILEQKRLGQKNGIGFYRYEPDAKGRLKKLPAEDTPALIAQVQSQTQAHFSDEEIRERMMLPIILEAAMALADGIAETPAEIDTALLLGLGFPRHVGGPLKYADWLGFDQVIARTDAYAKLGPLYQPAKVLRERAASGQLFYGN